jgi:hypothetical protein
MSFQILNAEVIQNKFKWYNAEEFRKKWSDVIKFTVRRVVGKERQRKEKYDKIS